MSVEQRNPYRRHAGIKVAASLLLLALASVGAQGTPPEVTEDFEDDNTSAFPNLSSPIFPTATWYTFSTETSGGNANPFVATDGPGLNYLHMTRTTSYTLVNPAIFTLNSPGAADLMEFDGRDKQSSGGGGGKFTLIRFYDAAGIQFLELSTDPVGSATPTSMSISGGPTSLNPQCSLISGGNIQVTSNQVFTNTFTLTFNWTSNSLDLSNEGDPEGSILRCNYSVAAAEIGKFAFYDGGTATRNSFSSFDNIRLVNIAQGEPGTPPPEIIQPIDAARNYVEESWGLERETVNWIFGIAIVGFVVVGFARVTNNPIVLAFAAVGGIGLAVAFGYFAQYVLLLLAFLLIAMGSKLLFGGRGGDGGEGA